MNLKVYEQHDSKKKVTLLKLAHIDSNITLLVVNQDGIPMSGGRLLMISPDGIFHRALGVFSESTGFPLDEKNRVKLGEDY